MSRSKRAFSRYACSQSCAVKLSLIHIFGADLVIHSATKFLGGHGAVMGGVVVDAGSFQFKGNPRFPLFNEPDESYHGVVFALSLIHI